MCCIPSESISREPQNGRGGGGYGRNVLMTGATYGVVVKTIAIPW